MPAKELTEANCRPRYNCSKLLLVDAIFISFTDRMLFTLTTLKNLENDISAAKNRALEQERFFHAKMKPSQSLMATDDALKLDYRYSSVIFVDPGIQIDET